MSRWEENIRKVIPYTPGEQPNQPDMIKLNTNENPYPPAPGVEKALREMDTDTMRLYPDPTAGELVHAIAKNYGLKGEAFEMPERSTKYGVFVDNQGTGSVYSLLCTQQGVNGSDEAVISIYRQGELKGSFVDNGNGELEFSSEDGSVKGIIQINGWDGASFEVTETSNPDTFPVGQKTEFPFAF